MNGANPPPRVPNGQHPGAPYNGPPAFNPAQPGHMGPPSAPMGPPPAPMGHMPAHMGPPPAPMGSPPAPTAPPWPAHVQMNAVPQSFNAPGLDPNQLVHTYNNCPMRVQDRLDSLDEYTFQRLLRFIPENSTIPPEDYQFLRRTHPGFYDRVTQLRFERHIAIQALRQSMEDLENLIRQEEHFVEFRHIMRVGVPYSE